MWRALNVSGSVDEEQALVLFIQGNAVEQSGLLRLKIEVHQNPK